MAKVLLTEKQAATLRKWRQFSVKNCLAEANHHLMALAREGSGYQVRVLELVTGQGVRYQMVEIRFPRGRRGKKGGVRAGK